MFIITQEGNTKRHETDIAHKYLVTIKICT